MKKFVGGAVAVVGLSAGTATAVAPPVDTATRAHAEAVFAEWLTNEGIDFGPASVACALSGQEGTAIGLCYANSEASGVLGYATITTDSGGTWDFTNLDDLGDAGAAADADAAATPAATLGDGTWIIGTDVEAGTFRTVVPTNSRNCYWERLSGFSGDLDDILANDNNDPGAQVIVEISPSDVGFTSRGCGTWERIS